MIFLLQAIIACILVLYTGNANCIRRRAERDEAKDSEWSLASLNPLTWLFPSKSDKRNIEQPYHPSENGHLPISSRSGLLDIKGKRTYNDLKFDRDFKERRKRRRKLHNPSLKRPWTLKKSSYPITEYERKRKRQKLSPKISIHEDDDRYANLDDYEEYYNEDYMPFSGMKIPVQNDSPEDLFIPEYTSR